MELSIGSMVQCILCFEICAPEGSARIDDVRLSDQFFIYSARASPKGERAAGVSIQSRRFSPIFSEMAGLIRSGLYTGNNQYVGENVKFIILNGFFKL